MNEKNRNEGRDVFIISNFLFWLYVVLGLRIRMFSYFLRWLVLKLEGGELCSRTIRRIMSSYYGVTIGLYSYGCFKLYNFRKGTVIGRYCSIYHTVQAFNANHPMNLQSTHPFFYNPVFGLTEKNILNYTNLTIGNDVFIGHGSIILPSVSSVGDGAVIGAGSVVNKNVPPFSIVVGNPARIVRYRFNKETREQILKSQWWNKDLDEISGDMGTFQKTFDGSDNVK